MVSSMASSSIAKRRAAAKSEASKHYVARRRELVKAAASVFREKGLAGTSLDEVAKAAGVDRASLYYYVGSKKELFEEVVRDAIVANVEMAERIRDEDGTPPAKLERLIGQLLVSYAEYYPHLYVFLQEDAARLAGARRRGEPDMLELHRRFDKAVIAIIEEGVDAGAFRGDVSPRLAAYGIVGMVNWTHRWFQPDGPVGAGEVGKAFAALAIEGLKTR
jgi:TetR/AcrR family transcriptional regulator, cholesterol catabolism regulator